jgi:glutamate formiminotransferase
MSNQRGQLIECVPNFSEGRNRAVIDAIAPGRRRSRA